VKVLPLFLMIGCASEADRAQAILDLTGDAATGETTYTQQCSACHAADGTGGTGPSLVAAYAEGEDLEMIDVILTGDDDMPGFEGTLSDQEIADVWAYVGTL
jgi:mono/diheme cytochrome c family protein